MGSVRTNIWVISIVSGIALAVLTPVLVVGNYLLGMKLDNWPPKELKR